MLLQVSCLRLPGSSFCVQSPSEPLSCWAVWDQRAPNTVHSTRSYWATEESWAIAPTYLQWNEEVDPLSKPQPARTLQNMSSSTDRDRSHADEVSDKANSCKMYVRAPHTHIRNVTLYTKQFIISHNAQGSQKRMETWFILKCNNQRSSHRRENVQIFFFLNLLKYLCYFRDPVCAQQKIKSHPKLFCMVLYVNQSISEAVTQFAP